MTVARRTQRRLAVFAAVAFVFSGGAACPAAAPDARAALDRKIDVAWRNVRLREALIRLGGVVGAPVFVDRRVDRELRATLEARGVTFGEAFERATSASGLGFAPFGPVVYVGPSRSAEAIDRVGPAAPPRLFQRRGSLEWPRLTTPRDLIGGAPAVGSRLRNAESIPHDLWPAGSLPVMRRADQLTLLLIGFDLTWEPTGASGSAWRVTPIDYDRLAAAPPRERTPSPRGRPRGTEEQRYTLRVAEQPLAAVLEQIAERVGRRLEIEPAAAMASAERVSFDVRDATLEELVAAAAEAAGLAASVGERRITLSAR